MREALPSPRTKLKSKGSRPRARGRGSTGRLGQRCVLKVVGDLGEIAQSQRVVTIAVSPRHIAPEE